MSPRALLFGLLVLVAAASAWILMTAPDPEGPVPVQPEPRVEADRPEPGTADPLPDPPANPGPTRSAVDVPDAPTPEAESFQAPSEDADALRVRCIDRDTEEVLANATVYYLDQTEMSEEQMWMALNSNASIADVLTRYSTRYRTDARGEVRVPYSDDLALAARHGELFLVESVWDSDPGGEVVLKLYKQPKLPVLVVDERGEPVPNASVTLRVIWDVWRMDMMRLDTDAHGRVTFEDFDMFAQSWDQETMYLGLGEALLEPVEVLLTEEMTAEDAEPVRLVMPAAGALEVAVFDHQGAPVADEVMVRLSPLYPNGEDEHGIGGDGRTAYALTRGGIARFDYVGIGQELLAGAFLNGMVQPSEASGRGPAAAGETARLELHEDVSFPIVIGRVEKDGEALAGEVVEVVLRVIGDHGTWDEERSTELDAEGRFRTQVSEFEAEPDQRRELLVRKSIDGEPYFARTPLAADFLRGEFDAGTFALVPEPVLLSGRVVDRAGQPIDGATLQLQVQSFYGDTPDDYYYEHLGTEGRSDADGSFSIRGIAGPTSDAVQVAVDHIDYLPSTQDVSLGQSGVEVRLDQAGSLSGSVLIDEGFPADLLGVTLEYPTGLAPELAQDLYLYASIDPDTLEFTFRQLPPGVVRVSIHADDELELAVIDGVVVAPDGTPDPRLQDIDLRGRVFVHELTVLDSDGAPVESAVAVEAGVEDSWNWGWEGHIRVVSSTPSVDVSVLAEGYRRAEVRGLSKTGEVRLAAGIEVVVRWSGPMPHLGEGLEWGVDLQPVNDAGYGWLQSGQVIFDDTKEARMTVGDPGQFTLTVSVHKTDGWNTYSVHTDSKSQIQVSEAGNPVFRVSAGEEEAEKARAWMKGQTEGGMELPVIER